jgi:hypothetical protein
VENPQVAVGWGDFVAVVEPDELDEPDEPESPDDEGDDVAAAGAASALAGEVDGSDDDSFLRLSVR